jgi:4-amino-4-deoxy-L-arabinose transferase-like glycosyltransferase
VRAILDRAPRAALICALVAALNAFAWTLVVPPFHVPDETAHASYAQYLAETGKTPRHVPAPVWSQEEAAAINGVLFPVVVGNRRARPPWTSLQEHALQASLERPLKRDDGGGDTAAVNNPPLYYALEAVPYHLGAAAGGDFLDRLWLMRLLNVLLASATCFFVVLFVREIFPGTPLAWAAAGLVVAFQPMYGFITGGVNNDNLLNAAAAAVFFVLARAFRRGLTPRLGLALGAAFVIGVLGKATLIAFAPGIALGVGILLWRAHRAGGPERRGALIGAVLAAGVVAAPIAIYVLLCATVWDRPVWGGAGGVSSTGQGKPANNREMLSYIWQFYLPRLPFMHDQQGAYPLWEVWFKGFIGRFGWLDYVFPAWVYRLAGIVVVPVLALAAAGLWRGRAALRRIAPELLTYLAIVAGLALLIGVAGYRARIDIGQLFEQARYLMPLLALYGAIVALAVRGAGRRAGPAVAGALVVLAIAHGLAAQLLAISRYYG